MRQGTVIILKIKVPAGLVSPEASLLGLQTDTLSLPLHVVVSVYTHPCCLSLCPDFLLTRIQVRLD